MSSQRYHGVAIGLHWLIAVIIIGMLAVGKFMTSLDESDSLRFELTQWHKSFGVVVLMLILLRVVWRITHRPPPLPGHLKSWEVLAAGLTHVFLYALMLMIPVSGWIMVSASPLELPTVIFDSIHWPHLPPFDSITNKEQVTEIFADIHDIAATLLILLLLAHIGAALRHRFQLRDGVMERMSPKAKHGAWVSGFRGITISVVLVTVALIVYGYSSSHSVPLGAGKSQVSFNFEVQGNVSEGQFTESSVDLLLNADHPAGSKLQATVNTATVTTGNSQIDSTLRGSDWFDIENHPQASFESTSLVTSGENSYSVSGILQIKGVSRELAFPLTLSNEQYKRFASGQFTVNRLDFNLGTNSQPTDGTVAYSVEVRFKFEIQ